MSLINIEYGSLASSEVLNKNFEYLEQKMEENLNSIMTSISSILSNIVTINSRLGEQAELIANNNSEAVANLEEYKNKTKIAIQKSCFIPHWNGCTTITIDGLYTVKANGYLLIVCNDDTNTPTLKINTTTINLENKNIKVTRLAYGLPMGGNLEYSDDVTIMKSFENRKSF